VSGDAHRLDLGPSDVHVPGGTRPDYVPTRTPTDLSDLRVKTMGDLDAAKRKAIPSGKFADPADRKYPVHDKAHADAAASRLEGQKAKMSPGKYARIKARIKAAQKRFGETPKAASSGGGRMRGGMKGLRMITTNADGSRVEIRHSMSVADADGIFVMPAMPITLGDD